MFRRCRDAILSRNKKRRLFSADVLSLFLIGFRPPQWFAETHRAELSLAQLGDHRRGLTGAAVKDQRRFAQR